MFLVMMGNARYACASAVPMCFIGVTTLTAGLLSIETIYWPLAHTPGEEFQGYLDSTLMVIFVLGVVIVLVEAARRCWETLHGEEVPEAFGTVSEGEALSMTCC